MPLLNMVDISNNQGPLDDTFYTQLHTLGVKTVAVKAAEYYSGAMQEDSQFQANWTQCLRHGFNRIAYLFAHPNIDLATQANYVNALVRNHGFVDGVDRLCADVEVDGFTVSMAGQLLSLMGPSTIFYSYLSYINTNLNGGHGLGQYPLWLADAGVAQPPIPTGWSTISYWQWGQQTIAGHLVDTNTDYSIHTTTPTEEDMPTAVVAPNGDIKVYTVGAGSRANHLLEFTRKATDQSNSVIDITLQIGGPDPYTIES